MGATPDQIDPVVQLSFAVQNVLARIAAANDLSVTQLRLLAILRDRAPAMGDLARHLELGKSSVSGLVDRAEQRGLVERAGAPHDGRAVHVRLTDEGRRLTESVAPEAYRALSRLLEGLGPEERSRLAALAAAAVGGPG